MYGKLIFNKAAFWWDCQDYPIGEKQSFQQMVLDESGHLNNEIGLDFVLYTKISSDEDLKWAKMIKFSGVNKSLCAWTLHKCLR